MKQSATVFVITALLACPVLALSEQTVETVQLANGDEIRRSHLFPITTEDENGKELLPGKRTIFDIGILTSGSKGALHCQFAAPLPGTIAAKEPWAPLHVYNSLPEEDRGHHKHESNVFFAGDKGFRNGGKDTADLTGILEPSIRDSLTLHRLADKPDLVEFKISFVRGPLKYNGLVRVSTAPNTDNSLCTAATNLCAAPLNENECKADGWTKRVSKLVAIGDRAGYLSDLLYGVTKGSEKNDIHSLWLHFVRLVQGKLVTEKEVIAKK